MSSRVRTRSSVPPRPASGQAIEGADSGRFPTLRPRHGSADAEDSKLGDVDGVARREPLATDVQPALPDGAHGRLERLAAVGVKAAETVHELRNALSVLETTLALLRRSLGKDVSARTVGYLDRMGEQIHAGHTIVHAVLDDVRLGSVELEWVDLRALVLEVSTSIAHVDAVQVDFNAEAIQVKLDRRQIRQMLLNLLRNAIEAVDSKGVVQLSAAVHGSVLHLVVADDGPGVDPVIAPRLFSAFATGKVGGTGLGLTVCRRIAEAHGGEIVVEAREPRGTRMVVRIPATTRR